MTWQCLDILIAVLMSIQYRKARVSGLPSGCWRWRLIGQTGFGVSNHILEVLITIVIRNGVLVAVVMVIQFVVTFT